jgi:adenosylhomocysteine nucleosidase
LATVIVVAGLALEARIAAGKHIRTICGGDGEMLATSLTSAIVGDCRGLISFGVAGGLSPGLRTGTCLVATSVISGSAQFITDRRWSRSLAELIPGSVQGAVAGVSGAAVAHPGAKHALHLRSGALAVDNESHVVASVAASRGLPMAAVRIVMDAAHHELPQSAWAAIRADGTIDLVALLRSIARNPEDLPLLLGTVRDAMVGFAALLRCRPSLGPGLGLPGFQIPAQPSAEPSGPAFCRLEEPYAERP